MWLWSLSLSKIIYPSTNQLLCFINAIIQLNDITLIIIQDIDIKRTKLLSLVFLVLIALGGIKFNKQKLYMDCYQLVKNHGRFNN